MIPIGTVLVLMIVYGVICFVGGFAIAGLALLMIGRKVQLDALGVSKKASR